MNIAGKVAVVTGAGSGIGQATALGLARRRARAVVAVDRSDRVFEAARLIDQELGRPMTQAFVGNASDAMPHGGTLTLRARRGALEASRPAVVIEWVDTGVGIPPEHLARVTEPFFTTKAEGKGTGLGLAICRRVFQEHRGTMRIESTVGQGTTVHIALPVASDTNVGRLCQP